MDFQKMVLIPSARYADLLREVKEKTDIKTADSAIEKQDGDIVRSPAAATAVKDTCKSDNFLNEELILQTIPKVYKTKAKALLTHILTSDILKWNKLGEIVYRDKVIAGTHITDLIKDTLRTYKNYNPIGKYEFYKALSEIHTPLSLIGNSQSDIHQLKRPANPTPPGIRENTGTGTKSVVNGNQSGGANNTKRKISPKYPMQTKKVKWIYF